MRGAFQFAVIKFVYRQVIKGLARSGSLLREFDIVEHGVVQELRHRYIESTANAVQRRHTYARNTLASENVADTLRLDPGKLAQSLFLHSPLFKDTA